ncbi:MAG: twitching motility protein PilT [Vicinamibacteraceae bacterium]
MLVLDAGALVAVERTDRDLIAMIKRERRAGRAPVTHGGVIGQVWQGGTGRQANLARLLPGLEIVALDEELGRRAGLLLGRARTSDVIDAAVALLAVDGDEVVTSDAEDIRRLLTVIGSHVDVIPV